MCGRFSLTLPIQELLEFLGAEKAEIVEPRFNIAPTQEIFILREGRESRRQLAPVRWGLIPSWSKEPPSGAPLINARCETVATKPSFRDSFLSRRCLVPATGFYEWKKEGRKRLPFHITYRDGKPMLFAGIWDRWQNPQQPKQIIDSCAILTCAACLEIQPLHNRMPVLIPAGSCDLWLHGESDEIAPLLVPYPCQDLLLTPANPVMNSGIVEGPDCLHPPQEELF
jgi:putative SOS response-associated peptidase YedK